MTNKEKLFYNKRKALDLPENKIPCTPEETAEFNELLKKGLPLPADIGYKCVESTSPNDPEKIIVTRVYHRIERMELSKEEIDELIQLKQLELLTSIHKHTKFFFILTIVALAIAAAVGLYACAMAM
jgi:hypothetical protein